MRVCTYAHTHTQTHTVAAAEEEEEAEEKAVGQQRQRWQRHVCPTAAFAAALGYTKSQCQQQLSVQ